MLGRRVDRTARSRCGRRRAGRRRRDTRALAAQQARRLRDDRARSAGTRRPCSSSCPDEPRVFPVGRLDLDTEGLLLLTNDGELAQLLTPPALTASRRSTSPRSRAGRHRRRCVRCAKASSSTTARPVRRASGSCSTRRRARARSTIVVKEGRKRMVRRMCASVGHPVVRLVRTRIGPLRDPQLAPGAVAGADARRRCGRCTPPRSKVRRSPPSNLADP